jgi:hypothetical protein
MAKKEAKVTKEAPFLRKITPDMAGGKARTVIFQLRNGVKVEACLDKFPADMVERLALHGLSQKGGDSITQASKDNDFHAAFGLIQGVVDNLENGLWSVRGGSSTSDLVAALADILETDLESAQAAVDKADDEQIAVLRKNPQVKAKILELQSERARKQAESADGEDLSSLFQQLVK